jgi:hypothetical protein
MMREFFGPAFMGLQLLMPLKSYLVTRTPASSLPRLWIFMFPEFAREWLVAKPNGYLTAQKNSALQLVLHPEQNATIKMCTVQHRQKWAQSSRSPQFGTLGPNKRPL